MSLRSLNSFVVNLLIFQVQIFTKDGVFVRKFGANVLQHPRGVTVDFRGRIVVVECKVLLLSIFVFFSFPSCFSLKQNAL